ncbi:hypothetical protein GCM10008967_14880 [Bacillus carboniphilus]|uniref:Uncharacterized protein n=1 Tax=Bacillus carboniphilus TaxID=86663 RepID=A0ABP3FTF1_9BACI
MLRYQHPEVSATSKGVSVDRHGTKVGFWSEINPEDFLHPDKTFGNGFYKLIKE